MWHNALAYDYLDSEFEFNYFMRKEGFDLLGCDGYDIGMIIHPHCELQLGGLKMVLEQLETKEEN